MTFTQLLPIPAPRVDIPFRSVSYYKNQYGIDLLRKSHDMQKEIQTSHQATDLANKILRISINGKQVTAPYNDKHLYNSKKIGPNDYVVTCHHVAPIEKQIGSDYCWAACLQYFLSREYRISVSQQRIVNEIKKGQPSDDLAASAMASIKALGFSGLTLTPSGSHQLIEALGRDHVAILGINNPDDVVGHEVVVVAARYSFVNNLSPMLPPGGGIAFSELTYLDPAEGKMIKKRAEEIDGQVGFILTQDLTRQ